MKFSLRPVEKMYLMCVAGKEKRDSGNMLAAVLVYLFSAGYLVMKDKEIDLTPDGRSAMASKVTVEHGILRDYEARILKCIDSNDKAGLISVVESSRIKDVLVDSGFLKIISEGWILKNEKIVGAGDFSQEIKKLDLEQNRMENAIARKERLEARDIVQAYAYPSLATGDGFKEYAESAENISEEAREAAAIAIVFIAAASAAMTVQISMAHHSSAHVCNH